MKYRITTITRFIVFDFLLLQFLSCSNGQKNNVNSFVEEYIDTVSSEHAKFKCNITEKMTSYYMDYENKEGDVPKVSFLSFPGLTRKSKCIYCNHLEIVVSSTTMTFGTY